MMTSGYSDYSYSQLSSNSRMFWTISEGYVQMITENPVPVTRYLKAKCGINDGWPARLECYKDVKFANEEETIIWRKCFTNVEYVDYTERRQRGAVVTIGMQKGNKILFYTDSDTSTMQWYNYCSLLFKIPKYAIPMPKENAALQQRNDLHAGNRWVVHILDKGIGCTKCIHGLCTVYICNSSSTLDICDFHNGKSLLRWSRDDIGLSGCIDSLVFVEVKETWCGGHAELLWMQELTRQSAALQKQIHDFLYAHPKECKTSSPVLYVFVDSAMRHTYIRDDIDPELSQTPYEDQLSDNSLPSLNTPVSQSASLSSGSSQFSSGYYSDSSYDDSISSRSSSQLSYPKVTTKCIPEKAEKDSPLSKKPAVVSSPPIQATSPTIKHNDSSIQREMSPSPNTHKKSASFQNHSAMRPYVHSSSARKTMIPKLPGSIYRQRTSNICHFPWPNTGHSLSVKGPMPNSSSNQATGTTFAKLTPQLTKNAFQKCSVIIADNLNLSEILPQLNSKRLLTKEDNEILQNDYTTRTKKIQHLLDELPRKGNNFFDDFRSCLDTTTNGTGHAEISKALSESYKEEVRNARSVDLSSGCTSAKKAPKYHSKK